jgi:prevent-host-death family protein
MAIQLELENLGDAITAALEKVRDGEEVTIADHGKAIAKLVPIEPKPLREPEQRIFGAFKGRGWIADDFDAPLPPDLQAEFEK